MSLHPAWQGLFETAGELLEHPFAPTPAETGPPELHVYLASKFPLALCGARSTLATFEEALKYQGTAGADRCAACMREYERIRAALA